jgi:hypothetical protein
MNFIKKYKTILLIIVPIVILVIIRSLGTNHFKTDARKNAEASFTRSNMLTPEKASGLEGEKLLVVFEKDVIKHNLEGEIISLTPETILEKKNIRKIMQHKGPVVLISSEISVSVRSWMLLSQMGAANIYILTEDTEPEVLKYEFRPDTLVRPEL